MGDIGIPELLIILAIAIVLFGPARIGGVGKSLGEAIRSFRHAVRSEDERPPAVEQPATVQPYQLEEQALLRESSSRVKME
ncbi:MAG: twin-arginine translocase TatA/TatE family subunit [Roseiflexaceae bacterium]